MTALNQLSRQNWLEEGIKRATSVFKQHGFEVPEVRISCGFPSTGKRGRRIGECWPTHICSGGLNEIFISPLVDNPLEVIGIIFHELVHAVDDCKSGHGKRFKEIATSIGLTGKMIHAHPNEELTSIARAIVEDLGPYPHKQLIVKPKAASKRERPYAQCEECGYRVPMLKKYLQFGPPICPVDHIQLVAEGNWD